MSAISPFLAGSSASVFFFRETCLINTLTNFPVFLETVGVANTCNINSPSGAAHVAHGTALFEGPGKLGVSFSKFSPRAPYWIIQYDGSYAVVWSCVEVFGIQVGATMWVLNRQPSMDPNQVKSVLATAKQQTGFDVSTVTPTVQKGCTY